MPVIYYAEKKTSVQKDNVSIKYFEAGIYIYTSKCKKNNISINVINHVCLKTCLLNIKMLS